VGLASLPLKTFWGPKHAEYGPILDPFPF